jgi:hypothetical protein
MRRSGSSALRMVLPESPSVTSRDETLHVAAPHVREAVIAERRENVPREVALVVAHDGRAVRLALSGEDVAGARAVDELGGGGADGDRGRFDVRPGPGGYDDGPPRRSGTGRRGARQEATRSQDAGLLQSAVMLKPIPSAPAPLRLVCT